MRRMGRVRDRAGFPAAACESRLKIPEGELVLAIDRFNEFSPCQNGGIVGFLHEHGTDSGCGDNNWPKTFVYLAGGASVTPR